MRRAVITFGLLILLAPWGAAQAWLRHELTAGVPQAEFGAFVGVIGDITGDGRDEVIAGAPFDDPFGGFEGSAYVFEGTGALLFAVHGTSSLQEFGCYVAGAGDLDADGLDDFVVGICGDDVGGADAGGARAFSGADGTELFTVYGDAAGQRFGHSVASAGDVNADGYDDIVVGAPGDFNASSYAGQVRIYSGLDGAVLRTHLGENGGDRFGYVVSGAGDVNADGHADIVVGAIGVSTNGNHSGRAYVYSGSDGTLLYAFDGDAAGDELGHGASALGDLDGDGYDDVFIAADHRPGTSYARVFSGQTGTPWIEVTGDGDFGHSCTLAGDVNGDGVVDLAVGAPSDDTVATDAGAVRIFSGADGTELAAHFGLAAMDRYGYVVSGGVDTNGDGFSEVIVGSSALDLSPGYVQVVSVAAGETYGEEGGTQTLDLAFSAGSGGAPASGLVVGQNAAPLATGLLVASSQPDPGTTALGVTVLVDTGPPLLAHGFFGFSPGGALFFPLNLRQPLIAGAAIYLQIFEIDFGAPQNFNASNGLLCLFAP